MRIRYIIIPNIVDSRMANVGSVLLKKLPSTQEYVDATIILRVMQKKQTWHLTVLCCWLTFGVATASK
jgi:hypothetical protein